ncbi:hypothetical protein BDP27DRAFT_1360475 [Rhodocollybia butyracea]|uniref:Uncharacterized protein n=1 Tax=Rhodocollybia butyracea TaxID=206335 RepID=A0A9P5Q399_9AGAR|nr:hypothetical protein BDP27DRAFT_1360475 [Rhodocollybia butyracea]
MSFMKLKTPSLPSVPKIPDHLPSLHVPVPSPSLSSLPSSESITSIVGDSHLHLPVHSPSLPNLPLSESITNMIGDTHTKVMSNMSMFIDDEEEEEEEGAEPPALEPVYTVLRPLNLAQAPQPLLKGVGKIVDEFEFENYLLLQHWGVLIGERYYHLHINDATQKISVSMVPFIHLHTHEHHTIKFPIWRTRLTHNKRVGIAVGIIKAMGNYHSEAEVEITDEEGNIVTSPEDRKRYRMEGRYHKPPLSALEIFTGQYNAVMNNCIHFTRHYIFDQILTRRKEMENFGTNIHWLVVKWQEMGCRRSPVELKRGARVIIKLLSMYLNIEYNPILDKKLLDDSTTAEEALQEVLEAPLGNRVEPVEVS